MIEEVHTSHLTRPCLREVQLTYEGHADKEYPSAMFRGQLFGYACGEIHLQGLWDGSKVESVTRAMAGKIVRESEDEGRYLTASVRENFKKHIAEVTEYCQHYARRLGPYFERCELLGVEVPVRHTIKVDDEPQEFASHIDLLWEGPSLWDWDSSPELHFGDWKLWEQKSVTVDYLSRNLQFGLYALCLATGRVQLPSFGWHKFGVVPQAVFIDGAKLKPYKRKTEAKDDDGVVQTYQKGDERPMKSVMRRLPDVGNLEEIERELVLRVRMMRAGFFPTNPDPVGCNLCSCRRACPSWQAN